MALAYNKEIEECVHVVEFDLSLCYFHNVLLILIGIGMFTHLNVWKDGLVVWIVIWETGFKRSFVARDLFSHEESASNSI